MAEAEPATDKKERLTQSIQESLARVERNASRFERMNTSLLIATIVTSAAVTLVNAITAAQGPIVGEGTSGWKLSCLIGAVLAFFATVATAVNQQMKLNDKSSKARVCVGRLRALKVSLDIGSREVSSISEEYAGLASEFAEVLR